MYDTEKAKQYAWEQADWIAHSNGYFLMKDCVFFYHKGNVVFDPWNDVDGNAVDDPFSFYGKDKMDEFCRRILAKKEGATPSRMIAVDSVTFDEGYKSYYYIADDDSIEVGDYVIVPAGKDNHEATVEVVKKEYFAADEVPLPMEKTKHIIRKCTEDDFDLPKE